MRGIRHLFRASIDLRFGSLKIPGSAIEPSIVDAWRRGSGRCRLLRWRSPDSAAKACPELGKRIGPRRRERATVRPYLALALAFTRHGKPIADELAEPRRIPEQVPAARARRIAARERRGFHPRRRPADRAAVRHTFGRSRGDDGGHGLASSGGKSLGRGTQNPPRPGLALPIGRSAPGVLPEFRDEPIP
jgi:hypothetical protein